MLKDTEAENVNLRIFQSLFLTPVTVEMQHDNSAELIKFHEIKKGFAKRLKIESMHECAALLKMG